MITGVFLGVLMIYYFKMQEYTTKQRHLYSLLAKAIIIVLLSLIVVLWSMSIDMNYVPTARDPLTPVEPIISMGNVMMFFFADIRALLIGFFIPFCFLTHFNFFGWFERHQSFNYQDKRQEERRSEISKKNNLRDIERYQQLANELEDTEKQIALGINIDDMTPLYLPKDFKNVFHVASTRSGKTVTMYNVVDYAIKYKHAITIIDAKADVNESSLYGKIAKRNNKKEHVIFDYSNKIINNEYYYNPFLNYEISEITDMLISMSDYSEEHYKANFKNYIYKILKIMKYLNEEINLVNIIYHFNFKNITNKINNIDDDLKQTKAKEYLKEINVTGIENALESIPRYEQLLYDEYKSIFTNDTGNKKPMNNLSAMNEKKLILHLIDSLSLPDTSRMLGKLILSEQRTAVNRTTNSDHKYAILDESNVYISEDIGFLLDKSLGKNHHTYLSTQSIADYDIVKEKLIDKVIENVRNNIVQIQATPHSAEYMAQVFGTKEVYETTSQIDKGEGTSAKGTFKVVNEYRVKPDDIKKFSIGHGAFLQKEIDTEIIATNAYFKFRQ